MTNLNFEKYKSEFLAIAEKNYLMGSSDFSDQDIRVGFNSGDTPYELMEWYAEKWIRPKKF